MSPTENTASHLLGRVLGRVPIAVAGSIAVTVGLIAPAQALPAPPAERSRDKAPQEGEDERDGTGAHDTVTSVVPAAAARSAAPAQTALAAAPSSYRVREGDTVSGIAARFGLSTASVLALNGLSWKSLIFPGQLLALSGAAAPTTVSTPDRSPEATKYEVVRGDTISGIAARFGVKTATVLSANGLSSSSLIFPGQLITIPGGSAVAVAAPAQAPAVPPAVNQPSARPNASAETGPVIPLSEEMRANAQLIVRVGRAEGVSDQGIVIALAAAAQESGLRNIRHGDRDSLGLFQQRPSTGWGTPAQVLDADRATRAFFGGGGNPNTGKTRGLLDIPGWTSMSVAQAAQAVQLSAHPDAYAKWEASARAWVAQLG
ncbi:lipoprotein [Leifsonia xyli subsp. cynodontis DSM 46306]|uniref:LysM domain-containing protein n=1 Tax=Leifsonia xyli subsp. cynodontis DSM 46306 TaxID=1389489 RepID=U3P786_LEIXC|nr:LysM peptidoglycan-binding domain-containing protein [Leifsonia xyli]AGW41691.1 lipoprotein [Leifsonia xyli subsp. cynodontis DSM 46306]